MMSSRATPIPYDSLPAKHPARSAVLLVSSSVHIEAPAQHVFRTLCDGGSWKHWNSFCPQVDVTYKSGDRNQTEQETGNGDATIGESAHLTLHVRMTPSSSSLIPQKVVVTDYSEYLASGPSAASGGRLYRIGWQAKGIPRMMLRADRTTEIEAVDRGEACQFRTWEGMGGPVSHIVKLMYGNTLQARFEDWANDLKEYAEKTWKAA